MRLTRLFLALSAILFALPAAAQTVVTATAPPTGQVVATASSPSGTLKVELSLNGEGRIHYAVSREGRPVLAESQMGFLFTDAAQMLLQQPANYLAKVKGA